MPAALFALTTVAFLLLPLLGMRTFGAVDSLESGAPYRDAIGRPPHVVSPIQTDQTEGLPETVAFFRELRNGHWQRWSPKVGGGVPTGTLPFNGLFSPFGVGSLVVPAWYGPGLKVALTLFFCQFFTYLLLRRLGAGRGAATLGAIAYAFAGVNLVLLQRVSAQLVLPALLWAVLRLVDRPGIWRALAVAGLVAWTWFEGFPSAFVYCVGLAVLWGAWLILRRTAPGPARDRVGVAARPTLWLVAALGLGVGLAGITLVPFFVEVARSAALARRTYGSGDHLPKLQLFGIFDLTAIGRYPKGNFWTGVNPVESVTNVGMVAIAGAAAALGAAALGWQRLTRLGRDAWLFFAAAGAVTALLVFLGTPLLGLAYRVPGIAQNPIQRLRFVIPLSVAVIAALGLSALWREGAENGDRRGAPRVASIALLLLGAAAVLVLAPEYIRAARAADELRNVGRGFLAAAAVAAIAVGAALLAARIPRLVVLSTVLIGGLLWWQLAWPLRNFTPAAPVRDFYTAQPGHAALAALLGGRARFLATDRSNFYLNSSLVFPLDDVRSGGGVLRTTEQQRLMATALPGAFDSDPFKTVVARDHVDVANALLDDLAVRYVAIGTNEQPFGVVRVQDQLSSVWMPPSALAAMPLRASGPVAAVVLQLRAAGSCRKGAVEVVLRGADGVAHTSSRPAYDVTGADGGRLPFAVDGQSLHLGDAYRLDVRATRGGCTIEAGATNGPGGQHFARGELGPDPAAPLRLASTEQAWIYERAWAWPFVSAHSRWRAFSSQTAALDFAAGRQAGDSDVVAYVGPHQQGAEDVRAPATVSGVRIRDEHVRFRSDGDRRSLVVVSQNGGADWRAKVDGKATPIVAVDGALMGVFVGPGRHDVSLTYNPWSVRAGLGLSAVAVLVGLAAATVALVRRRM